MDLEFGEKYEDFRSEVRSFLEEHKPDFGKNAGLSRDRRGPLIEWLTKQLEHGYWGRTIPSEYGGFGAQPDLLETVIMDEEFNRANVTRGFPAQGPSMLVPTLLEYGTEEQKKALRESQDRIREETAEQQLLEQQKALDGLENDKSMFEAMHIAKRK